MMRPAGPPRAPPSRAGATPTRGGGPPPPPSGKGPATTPAKTPQVSVVPETPVSSGNPKK